MPRNLSLGLRGEDVKAMQRLLNYHLPAPKFTPLVADGKFGTHTRDRVILFQTLNKFYPVKMPIKAVDGVVKKPLAIDGIVGPNTGRVLLDLRTVTLLPQSKLTPSESARSSSSGASSRSRFSVGDGPVVPPLPSVPPTPPPAPPGPPPPPPPPPAPLPPRTIQFVQLAAGGQGQLNPFVISPIVVTGQASFLARNAGRPDFITTGGAQFAFNRGTKNGDWTAQFFGQFSLGNLGVTLGPLDLANPFIGFMLSKNQDQPFTLGAAIGNQVNLTLSTVVINGIEQPRWSLFFNAQAAVNAGLNDGKLQAPSVSGLLGLSWLFGFGNKP